jgi:ATP-dependent DNA helicase RecG
LKIIKGEMSVVEMMMALKLGGRRNFLEKYLSPAIEFGLIEMTQPDSPRSPTQKYRLTEKGRELRVGE